MNNILLQNISFQKIKTILKMNQNILPDNSASQDTLMLIMTPLNSRGIFHDSTENLSKVFQVSPFWILAPYYESCETQVDLETSLTLESTAVEQNANHIPWQSQYFLFLWRIKTAG